MAALELLPTEILESILLFSLSFNLTVASPVLAGKLSSPHTYIRTVMEAFGPTWEHRYNCILDESLPSDRLPGDPATTIPGDPSLQVSLLQIFFKAPFNNYQSAVLRCRWATLPLLRKAEEEWLKQAGAKRHETALGML
jgi:hypothetical protein